MSHIVFKTLQELAVSVGLAVVGVADASELREDRERLRLWQEAGYSGEMAFMQRDPDLFSNPERLLPGVRSVVVFGAFYDRGERLPLPQGHGRVARYAWGRDYHKVLKARLDQLCTIVQQHLSAPFEYRVFTDAVPLLERALAQRAGLGFIGKNSMVIMPRAGSFLFLGEVLWNLEVSDLPAVPATQQSHCGSCSRCLDRCPTSAFVGERVLDARRCISYLTIEKRGYLSWQEREWLGEWVFGCDVCQDVCPFNVISISGRHQPDCPEFEAAAGVGQSLNLAEVLSIRSDAEYVRRFAGTPLMRAKREGLVRNAAVVAANTRSAELLDPLASAVREDSSPVVRAHALWGYVMASESLGTAAITSAKELIGVCVGDSDHIVSSEARDLLVRIG
jgi:epoxyqueuosine reductase